MKVLNMTIHTLTPSQIEDRGIEPSEEVKNEIKEYLLIKEKPKYKDMLRDNARNFAKLCKRLVSEYDGYVAVLIGSGTPSIQHYIVEELKSLKVEYVYSHSERNCKEIHNEDGTVSKTFVFEHKGWY